MLLELVSIIIKFILFSSSASLMCLRVGKPQWWPVFFYIAAVKDYGIPISPCLS